MSDLALQLEGHFVELTDRQQGPPLLYLFPLYPSTPNPSFASILLPHSLSLYLPDYYCSAAFDPPPSHQSMQTAERSERESRRMTSLDFQCFRCRLCHVRHRSDALFIYALIYAFFQAAPLPFCIPVIPLPPSLPLTPKQSAVKLFDFFLGQVSFPRCVFGFTTINIGYK